MFIIVHLVEVENKNLVGTKDYVYLKPDRVALQDVTGQMVLLQVILENYAFPGGLMIGTDSKINNKVIKY